ncbi:hypothetical protein T484DRAFT_1802752, partial [Baffinella frigidus]
MESDVHSPLVAAQPTAAAGPPPDAAMEIGHQGPGGGGAGAEQEAAHRPAGAGSGSPIAHGGEEIRTVSVMAVLFGFESGKPLSATVWDFLDTPGSSYGAMAWAFTMLVVILVSCSAFVLETMPNLCCGRYDAIWKPLETGCIVLFTIEYLLRLMSCPLEFGLKKAAAALLEAKLEATRLRLAEQAKGGASALWPDPSTTWISLRTRVRFVTNFLNIVDFIAIFPYYLEL